MIWVDMYRDVISLQVTYILSALCIADKLTHCNAHLGFIGAISMHLYKLIALMSILVP